MSQQTNHQASQISRFNPLQIPELLSSVLLQLRHAFWYEDDRTILECTLVNRLWNHEANRLLWEFTGQALGNNRHPLVRHLISIEKPRRQGYANYIRTLYLRTEPGDNSDRWEGRFYAELESLSFSALEELSVESPERFVNKDYPPISVALPYSQSRLRKLDIFSTSEDEFAKVDNEFLQELLKGSKNLKEFSVQILCSPCGISKAGFSDYLKGAQELSKLWLDVKPPVMSADALLSLARMPTLKLLCVRTIDSNWIQDLDSSAFPALTHLECGMDSRGLGIFLGIAKCLEFVNVKASIGSTDMIRNIGHTKLTHLKQLEIDPAPNTTASLRDLCRIAEMAPNLNALRIPAAYDDDMDYNMQLFDMGNEEFDSLAAQLPKLEQFQLLFENSRLTEKALMDLGRRCPLLNDCCLSVKVDYEKLVQEAMPGIFANLTSLRIIDPDDNDEEPESPDYSESLARQLVQLMPALDYPDFPANSDLSMGMRQVIFSRENSKTFEK